jgi:deaminated glutathione amidase
VSKVAAIQMTSGADVARNLDAARGMLRGARAQDAAVAVLPENFAFMGRGEEAKLAVAETPGAGPIQDFLAEAARQFGLWIVGGTIPLKVDDEPRVAAASLVFDAQGEQVARYDKIHLFDVDVPGKLESHRESKAVRPGSLPIVLDTPVGRLGLAACYDVRFPELFRALLAQGAQWFSLPSAFTVPTGRAHWELLLRARAVENLCYLVAPAQSGFHENGRETHGDSMIVEPWGRVVARLPRGTGVITAELDLDRQRRLRQDFPAVDHRRLALAAAATATVKDT